MSLFVTLLARYGHLLESLRLIAIRVHEGLVIVYDIFAVNVWLTLFIFLKRQSSGYQEADFVLA